MTLNITVLGTRAIYQCADYRLTDWTTGLFVDFKTQKVFLAGGAGWHATLCFCGVGNTSTVSVNDWIGERLQMLRLADPIDRLFELLLGADEWLKGLPDQQRRHTFTIGSFEGRTPMYTLISNFESPGNSSRPKAAEKLSVFRLKPTLPSTFVSGQPQAVVKAERRLLARLLERNPKPDRMYEELATINKLAAKRSKYVSPGAFTSHINVRGEGGGQVHDDAQRPFLASLSVAPGAKEMIEKLVEQQFGKDKARVVGIATARWEPTDEFHSIQLEERPTDANTHNNFGAYLKDKKNDVIGAERAYRDALRIDPNHVNALGNLANIHRERQEIDEATRLYEKALQLDPGNPSIISNYAKLKIQDKDDKEGAMCLIESGLQRAPANQALLLFGAELQLKNEPAESLKLLERARCAGGDQATTETLIALATYLNGAPGSECVDAYRTALSLDPENAALRLNLAQVLFQERRASEAKDELDRAIRSGRLQGGDLLEAHVYLLAYTDHNVRHAIEEVKALLQQGFRLKWNMGKEIEIVRVENEGRGNFLEKVVSVMEGAAPISELDPLVPNHLPARYK